jgi:dienelactone hydrolase
VTARQRLRAFGVAVVVGIMGAGCGGVATPGVAGSAALRTYLYRPFGDGPFPAVVLMHGCGGLSPNVTAWAHWLRAEGYAALVVDSFSSRGLNRVCGDGALLPPRMRSEDAFVAAASLRRESFIDRERIAAMGFSHGGQTVLWAARTETQHGDVRLKAFVALYPGCADLAGSLPGTAPVLMLLGAADDWTPAAPCQRLALRARAQRVVDEITYPDARHAFDGSHLKSRVFVADARRGQGATIEYNAAAHADAEKQIREFLARYLR